MGLIFRLIKKPLILIILLLIIALLLKKVAFRGDWFSSKPVIIDNTPLVIKEIKSLAQLNTATLYQEIVVDSLAPGIVSFAVPREIVLIVKGKVTAGINLDEIKDEDIFRMIEAKSLRQLGRHEHCIISCGGGTPCFHDNMKWMKEKGITVYLSASPTYLFTNILKDKAKRPVIKSVNESELLYFTEHKLKQRLPFYTLADIILNAEELDVSSFEKIPNAIKNQS